MGALKVLRRVTGRQCGMWLRQGFLNGLHADSMPLLPGLLEASDELDAEPRYSLDGQGVSRVAVSATVHRPPSRPGTGHRPAAGRVNDQDRPAGFRSPVKIRRAGQRGPCRAQTS